MIFLALNLFVTIVGFFFSVYIAASFDAKTFVYYSSWKQAQPVLQKIFTLNLQSIIGMSQVSIKDDFHVDVMRRLYATNAVSVAVTLGGMIFLLYIFEGRVLALYGSEYPFLILIGFFSILHVYLLAVLTYTQQAVLFWFFSALWMLCLSASVVFKSSSIRS